MCQENADLSRWLLFLSPEITGLAETADFKGFFYGIKPGFVGNYRKIPIGALGLGWDFDPKLGLGNSLKT